MGSDLYFYEQCETRKVPRRYRKLPEELPESLRFAHLNPKVAALLASKERGQRLDNEDPFGDGMGKKSLLPDINAAFTNVRNQFDSAMSNDEDSQRYLFEEAKISASQVLLQLSRIIYFYEDLCEHIPRSLEYQLLSGYEDFTKDIVVIPREWQTHEMKEQYANRIQQQEAISEEEMSDNDLTGRSRSRMQSERSSEVGSKMNIRKSKQKLGLLDVTEGVEPTESRMGKRSESRLSLAPSLMKGHLDVGNISRVGSRRKGSISGQSRRFRDDISLIAETPTEMRSTAMANQLSYMQTINFQLSNKSFEEKGWIMLKGRQEEVDQNTVLEYCVTRLQESMKDIANQRQKNLDQGHDKAVAVRYYGDTRKETLLKYRKSPVKSTSSLSLQKGGKPRIPSIVDECSEGKLLMQASHIDGSSVAYYPSGRPAIVHSAAGFGRPGYYTIVYEDELDSKMLACFTPAGRGVCYYPNGVVRYLATERGGHLTEENGKLIRKWKWPHSNVKITEPICFQINSQLMFRCVSQSQMFIVFSCQKESARFSVSPAPEADEYRPIEDTDQLLTAFTFSSKAAKDLMRIFAPKKQKKKSRKKKKKRQKDEIETKESESSKQVKFSEENLEKPTIASRFRRMSLAPTGQERVSVTAKSKSMRVLSPVFKFVKSLTKVPPNASPAEKAKAARRQSVTADSQSPQSQLANVRKQFADEERRQSISARARRQSITTDQKAAEVVSSRRQSISSSPHHVVSPRRPSISSDPQPRQGMSSRRQSLGSSLHATKLIQNMRRHSTGQNQQPVKDKSSRGQSLSPDMAGRRVKKSVLKNQDDLNKRAKSASQTKEIERIESREKVSAIKSGEMAVESSVETTTSLKHSESDICDNDIESKSNITVVSESSQNELASSQSSIMKMPVSILKKRQVKSVDFITTVNTDHKEVRLCKSAKLPTTSAAAAEGDEVEKRAQSATRHADQPSSSSLSDRQKYGRHQSSTSNISDKHSHIETSQTSGTNQDVSDNEGVTEDVSKQFLDVCAPQIVISEHVDIDMEDDHQSIATPIPILTVTDADDDGVATTDDKKQGDDQLNDGSKTEIVGENKETADEEQEEIDDLPPAIPFRRKRGGCASLLPDVSDTPSKDNNEEKDNGSENKTDDSKPPPAPKGRRVSNVMHSIMMYRKKMLAKKGIIVSSPSSSGTSCSDSDSDDSTTSKSQSTEIIKLLQDFPDRVTYDIEAEKELARLQRKARNLVDDWMEHYRIALGLKSPLLQNVDDLPKRRPGIRNIKSARASNHRLMIRKAIMGLDYEEDEDTLTARKKGRIPSAPLKGEIEDDIDEELQQMIAEKQQTVKFNETGEIEDDIDEELQQMIAEKQQTVKFNETGQAAGDGSNSPSLLTTINRLTDTASRRSARSKASSARSGSPYRAQPATQTERVPSATSGARSFCPLVIRQHKLNYDRPQCRCSRHHIPFIMDIELDDYIATETQESQLIVIMIVSSLKNIKNKVTNVDYDFYINKEGVPFHRVFPGITKAEEMLNEIYVNQNRNRTRPCVQSRTDVFRIFKYDINSAAEMSNHVTPLLMTRHNVVPGMFLIYCDGKLLFCDHIFNGYGNARKDFKKQVMKCRHDSIQGLYLPKDFRFSPSQGKSGLRSAWGGEIGGAGVDKYSSSGTVVDASLQPIHRPNSTPTSSENSQPLPYDSVKLEQAKYIIASLSATGYQTVDLGVKPTPSLPQQPRIQTA